MTYAAVVGLAALLFANANPTLPDWAQYGLLGLVLVGIVTKQIVPGWAYRDAEARVAKLEEDREELVELILAQQEKILPALVEGTHALREAGVAMADAHDELRRHRRDR